jgi:hypothetical protein
MRLVNDADALEKSANEFSAKAENARSFNDVRTLITKANRAGECESSRSCDLRKAIENHVNSNVRL